MDRKDRDRQNAEFVKRLLARRPHAKPDYEKRVDEARAIPRLEGVGGPSTTAIVNETIVRRERPVLFVKDDWLDTVHVTAFGEEARDLISSLDAQRAVMKPIIPLIGRIDVEAFPNLDYVGTGWFIDTDVVVTNRHVASLIARWDGRKYVFSRGVAGKSISASVCTEHEFDDVPEDNTRTFAVKEVLYIEPESGPNDIAFLKVERRTDGSKPDRVAIAPNDVGDNVPVFVVGYPARAPKSVIPDQALMKELYLDRYDVKRAAPGYTMATKDGTSRHDCTTLGGNSGSVVIDLKTGKAVGLHFAGLYQETNYAVRASVLTEYVNKKRWTRPPAIETQAPKQTRASSQPLQMSSVPAAVATGGAVTVTIPLTITVGLGAPVVPAVSVTTSTATARPDPAAAEAAAQAFWDQRPEGVMAARVGFLDDGDRIGDIPCIAASVAPDQLAAVEARGPANFRGFTVSYQPANVTEQIDAWPTVESVELHQL